MFVFKYGFLLAIAILFTGCASTEKPFYSHVKRPLTTDFELAMSLLNRPIPVDQQMMLAFVKTQQQQWGQMHYVNIVGPKDISPKPNHHSWLNYQIHQDNNAISITGVTPLVLE